MIPINPAGEADGRIQATLRSWAPDQPRGRRVVHAAGEPTVTGWLRRAPPCIPQAAKTARVVTHRAVVGRGGGEGSTFTLPADGNPEFALWAAAASGGGGAWVNYPIPP